MELSSPSNPDVDASAKPSRRKSGRVVKAPEFLAASGGATKRKRGEAEDGMEESQTEGNDSGEESEEMEARQRQQKAKRRNAAKSGPTKNKTDSHPSPLPIRPAPKARGKITKKATQPRSSAIGDVVGLYADLFASGASAADIVGQWLKRFSVHEAGALTEIVNFILRCTGCTIQVQVYDIEDPDNCSNKLTEIQDEFQAQNVVEYPLIHKDKRFSTAFRRNLTTFFNTLVHGIATTDLLYKSPELMENLQSWIVSMSSAASRPFRHTATAISLSIITALCEVGRDLVNSRAQTLRQSEGELKKRTKLNQARVKGLHSQAEQAAEQKTKLDDIIKDWYDTVFVHRYRDVDPKIRLDCMACLGDWIMTYPDHFLQGTHLRYLGWVMSDIAPTTRLEVVKQLHRIYKDDDKLAGLRDFTERFRSRMVEMAVQDADQAVRAAVVAMLDTLRAAGMLEPNDIDTIGQLIFDTELRVRKAVVTFFVASIEEIFASKVEDLGGQELLDEVWPMPALEDIGRPRLEWLKLKCLAELLQSFDSTEEPSIKSKQGSSGLVELMSLRSNTRITVAAISLWPKFSEMRQWEVLAAYLLFDHSTVTAMVNADDIDSQLKASCKLDSREEIILLDVLNTSVKQCLTDVIEEGTQQKKSKKSKAELQLQQEEREVAAQHLAVLIPKLLKKFGATPDAASAVLRLEHVLNLDVFQELRQDSTTYSTLLDDINKQFMSHENQNVLLEASKALQHAKSFEQLGEITDNKVQNLWEDVIRSLMKLCDGENLVLRGGIKSASLSEISSTILRISNLARISDCTEALETSRQTISNKSRRKQHDGKSITPISLLIQLLDRGQNSTRIDNAIDAAEDAIVANTLECIIFYFMWSIIALRSTLTANKMVHSAEIATLAERHALVISKLDVILAQRQELDNLRVEAAGVMIDLHSMFIALEQSSKAVKPSNSSILEHLSVELSPARQTQILRVFANVENDFAKKTKRQLEEASLDDEPEDLSDKEDSEPDAEEEPTDNVDQETADISRRKEARTARKEREQLLAEEKLCTFASKMVIAIRGGVMDKGQPDGPVRQRLSRNRAKLGHNFKEIVAALDKQPTVKGASSSKGKVAVGGKTKGKDNNKKSAEIAVDDSSDEEDEEAADDDAEETLRARGLAVDDDDDDANVAEGAELQNGTAGLDEADAESLLGD